MNVKIEEPRMNKLPPEGVMAAPNRCSIKAKVLEFKRSPQYKDKWHLSLEILESTAIEGPNFAHLRSRWQ